MLSHDLVQEIAGQQSEIASLQDKNRTLAWELNEAAERTEAAEKQALKTLRQFKRVSQSICSHHLSESHQ